MPSGPRVFICTDSGPMVDPNPNCPNAVQHQPSPERYIAASAWAEGALLVANQAECRVCVRCG